MYHPTRLIAYGASIVIFIMIFLAVVAYQSTRDDDNAHDHRVLQQLEKIQLIDDLSDNIKSRTGLLLSMLLQANQFSKPEFVSNIAQLRSVYGETKQRLLPMLSLREQENLRIIDHLNNEILFLNKQTIVLFQNFSRDEARKILLMEILPKSNSLANRLDELGQTQHSRIQKIIVQSNTKLKHDLLYFFLFALTAISISFAIALISTWFGRRLAGQLSEVNEYLEQKISERTESLMDTQTKLMEDNSELTKMALTDSLTGLSNRLFMNQILHKEHSRYLRYKKRFGIIMVDIDYFKSINDNFGHDAGDEILKQLANIFVQAIRSSDFIARWGGEEFLICCTNIDEVDLLPVAETIRECIANSDFRPVGKVTASLGGAAIVDGESIGELIKRADMALYEAKNSGRNQSIVSEFTGISLA